MTKLSQVALPFLLLATACSEPPPPEIGSTTQAACNCNVPNPPCCCHSPVLLDIAGDGFRLTSVEDGVQISTLPDHERTQRAWTEVGSDDAWLALDWNEDGVINDFTELFGNTTPQSVPEEGTTRNGFLALAESDGNNDGIIAADDPIFSSLRLWQDKNHDGESQAEELHPLTELGVVGLSLAYTEDRRGDEHNNLYRYKAMVFRADGSTVGAEAWDVWLAGVQPERKANALRTNSCHYAYRCNATCTQYANFPWDPSLCTPSQIDNYLGLDGSTRADGCFVAKLLCAAHLVTDTAHCSITTNTCNEADCMQYLRCPADPTCE